MSNSNHMTINLLLLGRTQSGKSSAGNILLGSVDFASLLSPCSLTQVCNLGRSCHISSFARRQGSELTLQVSVLDTPGYPHTRLSNEQVHQEVKNNLTQHFGEKGLHLALLVLRADVPLCSGEEEPIVELVQTLLGPNWKTYTVILFTHADQVEQAGFSTEQYLHSASGTLHKLMQLVQQKYVFVNNHARMAKEENLKVLRKIMVFIRQNHYQTLLPK